MDAGRPSTPAAPGVQPSDPLRKASMKDTTGKNQQDGRRRPDENADDSLDALLSSYTPRQRKTILKGLRILARAALRAHMERRWPGSTTPPDGEDRAVGRQTDE